MIWINNAKLCAAFERLNAYPVASPWIQLHARENAFFHSIQYYCDRTGMMLPIFNHALDQHFLMPKHRPSASWQEINDRRATDIERNAQQDVYIMWSGGIDSTNCVAAIIKNCSKEFRNNARIVCTDDSLWENPYFYRDQILPNFPHLVNGISFNVTQTIQDSLVITGGMGDRIFGGDLWSMWHRLHPDIENSYSSHKDQIISFLNSTLKDTALSAWLYQIAENSWQHHELVIQTCYDFFWWIEFNFTWVGMYFCVLKNLPEIGPRSLQDFKKNYVMWYDTTEFQSWSLDSIGSDLKYDFANNTAKKSARDYIFDLDGNDWYRDYKVKIESVRKTFEFNPNPCLLGITGGGELLEIDVDTVTDTVPLLEKIQRLSTN